MIQERQGNLFEQKDDVIIHGCNCKNTMGAGVAKEIRRLYPGAWREDQRTLWGDKNKLGTYTAWTGKHHFYDQQITVVNAYTQYEYGHRKVYADYDAIEKVMNLIKEDFADKTYIGMPKIGAGLARGDWSTIWEILTGVFGDNEQIVTVWRL